MCLPQLRHATGCILHYDQNTSLSTNQSFNCRFNPELFSILQLNVAHMSAAERSTVLQENPVLAARIAHSRITALFKTIIQGAARPFGKVADFWYRIEFQARGTPHAHILLWLFKKMREGSVEFNDDDDISPEFRKYIEKTFSCTLPELSLKLETEDAVQKLQAAKKADVLLEASSVEASVGASSASAAQLASNVATLVAKAQASRALSDDAKEVLALSVLKLENERRKDFCPVKG